MAVYFRAQTKGYSFEDMKSFVSGDGGDGMGEEAGGVCACISPDDLRRNTVMDAMEPDDDVIVFEGYALAEIYDGYRVQPVRELLRMTVQQFREELVKDEPVWEAFCS